LLGRLLGDGIQVETRLAEDPWRACIDPGGFEQLVINLAVNGRDAMPGGGGLTIETLNVSIDEPQALSRGQIIAAGDYVVLAVTDEGTGMAPAMIEQIFEPFFTTKKAGKGTGLGLSTCYGIARQAGGHISVYSEVGHGSTFKVYLPRADGAVSEAAAVAPARVVGGHETILLVEDDAQVRQVAERVLRRWGYTVLSADSPAAATALFAAQARPPDLLLTDMTLPGGNGHELALRLRARHPLLRALYISGYTEASITRRGALPPGVIMLPKPFTATALARGVRQALDGAPLASPGAAATPELESLVLIVDDDEALRRSLRRQLVALGYQVVEAENGDRAIEVASEREPSVIFLDIHMDGMDGHTLLRALGSAGVRSSVVVMSGAGGVDDVIRALRNGAADYLKKPWSAEDLAFAVNRAADLYRTREPKAG
jgi:CheY-like chemotaxis protein